MIKIYVAVALNIFSVRSILLVYILSNLHLWGSKFLPRQFSLNKILGLKFSSSGKNQIEKQWRDIVIEFFSDMPSLLSIVIYSIND